MCQWGWMPCLSAVLHLLYWLSWKVRLPIDLSVFVLNKLTRVLLATIQDKGLCPCPRCLAPKMKLDLMGQHNDSKTQKTLRTYMHHLVTQACSFIYDKAIVMFGFWRNLDITELKTKEWKQVWLVVIGLPGATGMPVWKQETKVKVGWLELSQTLTESNE